MAPIHPPRVLFISGELIAGDVALRLQGEGCAVKLFIDHPEQQHCLDGFVEKTTDWRGELEWVGKEGLIVFDDVGYGEEQETLRAAGYSVFGGSIGGDKLENDRVFCNDVLREYGFEVVPVVNFPSPKEARQYVLENPGVWVVKQNTHQSALNYVGCRLDGSDVVSVLQHYEAAGVASVALQSKVDGIEIGVARYFNGRDWVGPIEFNVEHKALFAGDIGPKTGEMGTLLWYSDDESSRLYCETLAKLRPWLQSIDYRGDIDVNVFVNRQKIIPIELTARLGCPSTHMHSTLHISPWSEFLLAVAQGRPYSLEYQQGYGVVLTLAVPPFPYEGKIDPAYLSDGLPVLFDPMSDDEWNRVHLEGIQKILDKDQAQYFVSHSIGYVAFASGIGPDITTAREQALLTARKVHIPKIFYRNDIGVKFEQEELSLLREWGWLP